MTNILKNSIFLGLLLFCLYILYTPQQAQAVWVFEDLFNSDTKSTGDLNSQDGWSGDTDFDVVTTNPYEGDQHVTVTNGNGVISYTFGSVEPATFYIAMWKNNTVSDGGIRVTNGSTRSFYSNFQGSNFVTANGASSATVITNFNTSTWYTFEYTLNNNNTYNIRYTTDGTWSSSFGPYNYENSGGATVLQLSSGGPGGSSHTEYFDYISPTDPFAVAATAPYVAPSLFFLR